MGMDVFGRKPTAPQGECFSRHIWGWHPLADLCRHLAPDLTAACKHWYFNAGDGLAARDAEKLAERLNELVKDGSVAAYIGERDAILAPLLDEPCARCAGTGVFSNDPDVKPAPACQTCKGTGKRRAWARNYYVRVVDVEEWIAFLVACGGFRIY